MSSAHGPEFFEHEEDHDVDLTSPVFLDDLDDEEDEAPDSLMLSG